MHLIVKYVDTYYIEIIFIHLHTSMQFFFSVLSMNPVFSSINNLDQYGFKYSS